MDITDLLVYAHKSKASDLHISSGNPPIVRINGDMTPHPMGALTAPQIKDMLYSIMNEAQRSEYERDLDLDFAISFGDGMRFRVNAFNTVHGPGAVMRTIPTQVRTLEELGAPGVLKKFAELKNGLILVTGPTGSGKSTTLAALVDYINTNYAKHILTIEDPVEFVHTSKKSLINQREVGANTRSFAKALKSSLREDPDVILVGEMRELETIQLAMTAAETGHIVLGTLHTKSAPDSIDRVIDVFPAESKEMVRAMLANTLQGVVTQALLKSKEGGRCACYEIMIGTPAIRNLIREGKVPQLLSMIQMGSRYGMTTMKDSINALVQQGKIDEEVARHALATVVEDSTGSKPAEGGAAKGGKAVPPPAAPPPKPAAASGSF